MKKANPQINEGQPVEKANTTASSQRKAILNCLRQRDHLTTLEAREQLGIMSPAPRILELRGAGHRIDTRWIISKDITGKKHRQAKYVLMGEPIKKAQTRLNIKV